MVDDKEFNFTNISSKDFSNHNEILEYFKVDEEIKKLDEGVIIHHRKPNNTPLNYLKKTKSIQSEEEKKKTEYIFSNMIMNFYIL